ncbi:hypothetical protein EC100833_3964, partial [Escherichia coli 10.0833]
MIIFFSLPQTLLFISTVSVFSFKEDL